MVRLLVAGRVDIQWANGFVRNRGTGNYDVNVMMVALQRRGLATRWIDKRRPVPSERTLRRLVGVILNRRTTQLWGLRSSKHWFAFVQVHDVFYLFNSEEERPQPFSSLKDVQSYLKDFLWQSDGSPSRNEALLVQAEATAADEGQQEEEGSEQREEKEEEEGIAAGAMKEEEFEKREHDDETKNELSNE